MFSYSLIINLSIMTQVLKYQNVSQLILKIYPYSDIRMSLHVILTFNLIHIYKRDTNISKEWDSQILIYHYKQ